MTNTRTVRVYHNVARDFQDRPTGLMYGYRPGDPVVLVAVLDVTANSTMPGTCCEEAFRVFNIGHEPEYGPPHPEALAYKARGNRSLSRGDLVEVNGNFYACASVGWTVENAPPKVVTQETYGTTPLQVEES